MSDDIEDITRLKNKTITEIFHEFNSDIVCQNPKTLIPEKVIINQDIIFRIEILTNGVNGKLNVEEDNGQQYFDE